MDIQQILTELRGQRDRIDRAIASLESGLADGRSRSIAPAKSREPKGGITAAGRKRLSEAMKRRWAERRGQKLKPASSVATTSGKKRGGMSAAGRKRISEMMKKRWAERRRSMK